MGEQSRNVGSCWAQVKEVGPLVPVKVWILERKTLLLLWLRKHGQGMEYGAMGKDTVTWASVWSGKRIKVNIDSCLGVWTKGIGAPGICVAGGLGSRRCQRRLVGVTQACRRKSLTGGCVQDHWIQG